MIKIRRLVSGAASVSKSMMCNPRCNPMLSTLSHDMIRLNLIHNSMRKICGGPISPGE